jgi:beta-lactam-binding protein with PASTA domain
MRTCQSCGLQNPPDRDFCECGEYLRWEPTGYVQAITPEMAAQAAAEAAAPAQQTPAADGAGAAAPPTPETPPAPAQPAAPAAPQVNEATTPAAPPGNGHGSGLTTGEPVGGSSTAEPPAQPPAAKTAVQAAVPVPPPKPEQFQDPDMARITLRLPDRDAAMDQALQTSVEPGQRDKVLALVRNQSGIVDNYVLTVDGLPDDWYAIYPDTVYLVPFGTGGTYEQEVEIHIHPPRTPQAEAKLWELTVVAHSKAHGTTAASAPLGLTILPYTETATKLSPQRSKGRRKAHFDVAVENKANAPVLVALEGEDDDGELEFGFNRPPQQIPPGQTVTSEMQVRPPKQIWIGRPQERRLTVRTLTGEEAEERLAADPTSADELKGQPDVRAGKRGWFRRRSMGNVPGVYGPRVYKPQVYKPGMNIGPSGISFRKPQLKGPQLQGPQLGSVNMDANKLQGKLPGRGGGTPTPQTPLLPSQGVFRQKPWLPWWLVPVGIALAAIAVLLYLLLPKNVVVPDLVGQKSTFDAEKKLTDADLKLAPDQKAKVDPKAPAGSIVGQTPAAGEKAKKDSTVTVLVAVGDGKITVPKIVGLSLSDAEAALRDKKLSLGQSSPQPPDPNGKIASQIPAENEVVKEGTPVDVFFEDPNGKGKGKDPKKGGGAGAAAAGGAGGGGGGGGGGGAKDIVIPAVAGAPVADYAKKLADLGLVPATERVFDASPRNTAFATEPPGGTKAAAGDTVKVLVSAGFPELAFDNEKNVLLVNGANGKPLKPIAKSPSDEKDVTWSFDGSNVAYVGGGRVFLKDMSKPDAPAKSLTQTGDEFSDLAWAPTADLNLIAMARHKGTDADLCLGELTKDGLTTRCIIEPKFTIGRNIHWRPNGKEIIAVGSPKQGTFGMVRWTSKKPFSTDPADWGKGKIVTDTSKSNEGVYDAAWSPDGKRLALVSNQGGGAFQLYLAKPNDFLLTSAKPTGVRACKVAWRSDNREIAVVQADEKCIEENGELVRLPVNNPGKQEQIGFNGDNPAYQPLTLGQ